MRPLSGPEIRGTWATLLLPIDSRENIDLYRLADEIDYLLSTDVDGIYSNGTAGEFYAQSEEEFIHLHDLLAAKCESVQMAFQIGASHPCAQTCLARARRAREWAPSAIQITLPDWVPTSLLETRHFVETIATAVDPVRLILYNPPHAKRVLSAMELASLACDFPAISGVKVALGDDAWFQTIKREAPQLSVFVPGHKLATGCRLGADGSYSNVACLQPAGAKRWNILMASNPELALEIEVRLGKLMSEFIAPLRQQYAVAPHAADKFLAAIGGWIDIGTRMRWPYETLPLEEAMRLRPIARELVPELFA